MNMSEHINELVSALSKAQAEIQNPAKESVNPHFKNTYANLASGLNVVRTALSKHGLVITQPTRLDGELMMLDTRIMHSSGQWIGSTYPVCKTGIPQQQIGSALTYSRRYALFSLVGIAGEDDDDDGNEGSKTIVPAARNHRVQDVASAASEADLYVKEAKKVLRGFQNADRLNDWWRSEKPHRENAGVYNETPEYEDLLAAVKETKQRFAEPATPFN